MTDEITTAAEAAESTTETVTEQAADIIHEEVDKAADIFTNLGNWIKSALPSLIIAIIMLIIGIVAVKIISHIVSKAFKRSNMDNAARSFLTSLIRITLYIIVIMMVLTMLNVPMSSIITVFGAAGLAVSLALQNCLSNLCGGFIILFSKPFTAGDMIEIDGLVGTVKSINILYTRIVTVDNKVIIIPNGNVSESKIINYTESPTRRVDMNFSVSYDTDFEKAKNLILSVIKNDKLILDNPEPTVRMSAHNDSSIAIDVLVWTENGNYYTVKYNLNENIKKIFDENKIEIPYNQLDVHIKKHDN